MKELIFLKNSSNCLSGVVEIGIETSIFRPLSPFSKWARMGQAGPD